jgi:hypothetical protein
MEPRRSPANVICGWSSASTPVTTLRIGHTGRCTRIRPPRKEEEANEHDRRG